MGPNLCWELPCESSKSDGAPKNAARNPFRRLGDEEGIVRCGCAEILERVGDSVEGGVPQGCSTMLLPEPGGRGTCAP